MTSTLFCKGNLSLANDPFQDEPAGKINVGGATTSLAVVAMLNAKHVSIA